MTEPFISLLRKDHPEIADDILSGLAQPAPVSVRLNPNKTSGFDASLLQPIPWEPNGYYLENRPSFTLDPHFHAGGYYVQEASSMWIGAVWRQISADKKQPWRILDLCAAPGGKSTHLASLIAPEDLLVSNEVIRTRAQILTENLMKWGTSNQVVTGNDPAHFQSMGSWFDVVLVDAPCSGEGLFRRDPDAVREWSPEAVSHCSLRQQRILDDIWPALRPGGYLIYSTCTFNRSENEDRIASILASSEATSVRFMFDASTGLLETSTANADGWMYRSFPGFVKGEGFSFGIIQKKTDAVWHSPTQTRKKPAFQKAKPSVWSGALDNPDSYIPYQRAKSFYAIPEIHEREIIQIDDSLYIHHAGIELGDAFRPSHNLILSNAYKSGFFPEIHPEPDDVLNYLRRETIPVEAHLNGYHLLRWNGSRIGLGKATRGRLNNHYPMEWRIRFK